MATTNKRIKSSSSRSLLSKSAGWGGRILVLALIVYSPWYYGMVTWGQQMLLLPWVTAILVCTLVSALSHKEFKLPVSPMLVSLFLILGLASLQVIPLPGFLYDAIAPGAVFERQTVALAAEYLSVDASDAQLIEAARNTGPYDRTLSIHPLQTRASLVGLTAAVAVLLCSSLLFHGRLGRTLLLGTLSAIATVLAVVGLLQNLAWSHWSLLDMPTDGYFSTFVSRNSAPQYLAIGIGSTIALLLLSLNKKRREDRYMHRYRATTALGRLRHFLEDSIREIDAKMIVLGVALILQVAGVIGAASRGGIVSLLFALSITLLLSLGRNRRFVGTGVLGFGLIALLSLAFIDSLELGDKITGRLEFEGIESPARLDFWKIALSQSQYWVTGCGLGNFHFALLPANSMVQYWIYHAESIYVELFTELGIPGTLLAFIAIAWLVSQLFRRESSRSLATWPAVMYTVCAIGLHSLVDFSLIIPAIFLSVSALLGTFLGELYQRAQSSRAIPTMPSSKLGLVVLVGALLILLWQGNQPLRGFAQAEALDASARSADVNPDSKQFNVGDTLDTTHPEILLQLSKKKVLAIEEHLQKATRWPQRIKAEEIDLYSKLEIVNSVLRSDDAFRSSDKLILGELAQVWSKIEKLSEWTNVCLQGFSRMSRDCVYDWRGHWGTFQSSLATDRTKLALTCARLRLLTNSMPQLQQSVGTCCLIAGDRTIGLNFWNNTLDYYPMQASNLAALLGPFLDSHDLESVMPDSQLARAGLARALIKQQSTVPAGKKLLQTLELPRLKDEAKNLNDWNLVVWAAEQRADDELYIRSLQIVADLRPLDKYVRVRLAQAYEKAGDIEEAILQLEQASRRTTLEPAEYAYLQRLQNSRRIPPPNGNRDFDD